MGIERKKVQKLLHNSAFACKDDNVSTENDKVAAKNDEYDAKVGEAAQRDA